MPEDSKAIQPRIVYIKDRYETAFPNEKANLNAGKVILLQEALSTNFKTDAHALLYLPKEGETTPRILKDYFSMYEKPLQIEVFFADCDNHGHQRWTEESLQEHIKEVAQSDQSDGLGIFYTQNGFRLFQALSAPLFISRPEIVERHIFKWFKELEKRGFDVDYNCRDVTHLFRLPNVRRDGKDYKSPYVDMSRMRPLVIDVLDLGSEDEEIEHPTKKNPEYYSMVPEWAGDLPADLDAKAKRIAEELKKIQDIWHPIYLGIAGALHSRGIDIGMLPLMCRQIAFWAHDDRPEDRFNVGKSTATKRYNGQATRGLTYLYNKYPELAKAIDLAFGAIKEENPSDNKTSIDLVYSNMKEVLHNAEPGVTVCQVDVGVGKTACAIEVAIEREQSGLRTAISVDKNILAKQVASDIRKFGSEANRIFGALSLKDDIGNPVCIHHDIAKNLAEGGQSISFELCQGRGEERCIMYDTCAARLGFEGAEDSDIMVSNHNKLGQMVEHTGKKGLLVIDEPKSLTVTYKITKRQKELIQKRMDNFEYRYMRYMQSYLNRVISWEDHELSFEDLTLDVDLLALQDLETRHKKGVPPIKSNYISMFRKHSDIAEEIGQVSKLIYLLYRAKTERSIVVLAEDSIEITMYDEDMRNAILREGTVVITDANADLFMDQLEAMLGYRPEYFQQSVGDSAPMERTWLKTKGANRKNWTPFGKPAWNTGLQDCLKHIAEWHKSGNSIGIITFYQIEKAIREKQVEVPKELIDMNPVLAHYYNIRGMNDMKDFDELVTLGDPWKNRGIVKREMEFHGIKGDLEPYEKRVCQAELYQSHGRLRPTRRKKPGRMLHVGNVIPGGNWANVIIRHRPRSGSSIIRPDEVKHIMTKHDISQSELGKLIELDKSALSRFLKGYTNLPYEAGIKLRNIK